MSLQLPRTLRPLIINDIPKALAKKWGKAECDTRCTLATAYRLVDCYGWGDLIYGHLTCKVPETNHFLINPYGMHFKEVSAASLIKVDTDGNIIDPGTTKFPFQMTGYVIHSAIHSARPDLKAVFHIHTREGMAVSCSPAPLYPVSQTGALTIPHTYHDYQGVVVDDEEKDALRKSFNPPSKNLILKNHGLVSGGDNIEETLANLYFLHSYCQTYVDAGFINDPKTAKMVALTDEVIQKAKSGARKVRSQINKGVGEFEALARQLDYAGMETGYPYSDASRDILTKYFNRE